MEKIQTTMNKQFITKLTKALGDDFFLCDMIYQEELFVKQEEIASIIFEYANKGCPIALLMAENLPMTFEKK